MEEFIKSKEDLQELAAVLQKIAQDTGKAVCRYRQTLFDILFMDRGRKNINRTALSCTYNVEDMEHQLYSSVRGEELFPFNLPDFERWRERMETPFIFQPKGFDLSQEQSAIWHKPPSNFQQWDDELLALTKSIHNIRITRELGVEQSITVNSEGGFIIESKPFLSIHYRQGYHPFMVTRSIGAYVCNEDQLDAIPKLIQYISDPTPDRRIRKSGSFVDAFEQLYSISNHIHCENLEDCGLGETLTHDAIVLSGVPAHEIFGHQFEEPVHPLNVGQQSLFPVGKDVENLDLILQDNPCQQLEGLNVLGTYQHDCYGRASHLTRHIEDSKVVDHLGGEYIDHKNLKKFLNIEESRAMGCSRQGDDGGFPVPRMSCTVLNGKEETIDWGGKVIMVPFDGYVLDGNFFKIMSSECYVQDSNGEPKRIGPLEGSRAIYDALNGMHILPEKCYHVGTCSKPNVLDNNLDSEVTVSFYTNYQMWEHLTLRTV